MAHTSPKCKCCKVNEVDYLATGLCEACEFDAYVKSGGKIEEGDHGPFGNLDA